MIVMRWLLLGQFAAVIFLYALMLARLARMIRLERRVDRRAHPRNGDVKARHPLMARLLWGFALIVAAMLLSFTGISIVLLWYWAPELGPWRIPLWELEALLAFWGIVAFLRVEILTDLVDLPVNLPTPLEREERRDEPRADGRGLDRLR